MRRATVLACVILLLGLGATVVRQGEVGTSPRRSARPVVAAGTPVSGVTHLLVVDDEGRPVAGMPLWEGEPVTTSRTDADGVMRDQNAGRVLGSTDAAGVFVPEQLPVTVNVSPWPSSPEFVTLTDTGGEHRLTVASACTVALTWDRPEDEVIVGIELGQHARSAIGPGRATLIVPCGETTVTAETPFAEATRLEPEPSEIDSHVATAHIAWVPREHVRICVSDEAGARVDDADVLLAWRIGDCWAYPYPGCARISAPGFLTAEHCSESEFDWWQADSYSVALERSVTVAVRCDPAPCPERMGALLCVSDTTPDLGACKDLLCGCPDAADARVVVHAGAFAGETAPVRNGVATLAHTGTASLVVPGTEWCNAMLLREERDGMLVVGKMACENGRAVHRGLVAGRYQIETYDACGNASWGEIDVAAGREHVEDIQLPGGKPVEMDAEVGFTILLRGRYRVDAFGPLPEECQVPAGATVWVCKEDGCCRVEDPRERVTCEPDARLTPPMRAGLRM